MIKIDKVPEGAYLYDRHRTKMGNTTISNLRESSVFVVKKLGYRVVVQWNGNRPETWRVSDVERLHSWSQYDDCAEVTRGIFGSVQKVKMKKGVKKPELEVDAKRAAEVWEACKDKFKAYVEDAKP